MEGLNSPNYYKNSVHWVLTHGYATHFVMFLLGVSLDLVFHFNLFSHPLIGQIGVALLILASALILWAQATSRKLPQENITLQTFLHGPYRYTRSPTHWGLLFLALGFGIIADAFFVVVTSILAFIFSKLVFLKREEQLLADKYGAPYLEYKNKVKF